MKKRSFLPGALVVIAVVWIAGSGHAQTYKLRSPVGTNLDMISFWSPQVPFVDVMKSASPWISADRAKSATQWDDQRKIDLDENGWVRSLAPGQIVRGFTLRETNSPYPAGQYMVRYKGRGTLKFMFDAREISRTQGEIVLDVKPSNAGIGMMIETTDPVDYLRDIAITLPGGICEGDPFMQVGSVTQCGKARYLSFADHHRSILFNPAFLDRLRNYSVLRFVDWMQSNNSVVSYWSQRTPVSYQTWTKPSGAPVEIMIELANRVGAHPWFNMPHQSDDAYANQFAQMVKARLHPALRIYLEHSNEVWNGQFPQYAHITKKAAGQSPALDNMQYHALRTRAVGQIFKTVLGPERVVAVLAAQAANPATAIGGLNYLKSRFDKAIGVDAVAIAPYFGIMPDPAAAPKIAAMPLNALFEHVRATALPTSLAYVKNYKHLANEHGLRLVSYEGGQHMVGVNNAHHNVDLNKLFHAFNRDPRIKTLYLDYLAGWKRAGGELFMHYTDVGKYGIWGSWGALEYVTQPRTTAHKFDALQSFIEQNPVWWSQ